MDERLMEYVLGQLAEDDCRQVEALLAASPAARAQVRELSELLAGIGEDLPAMQPSPALRDRLLADAEPKPRLHGVVDAFARLVDWTRAAAAALLSTVDEPGRWGHNAWPGIDIFHIEPGPRLAGAEVGFVRMAPGARFPWHGHDGDELNLILQGSVQISDGTVLGPGDMYPGSADIAHDFVALDGPDVFLVAVLHCNLLFADGTVHGKYTPH